MIIFPTSLRHSLVWLPGAVLLLLLPACAARTNLEPAGEGRLQANASIGGPLVAAFGTNPPIPNLTIGANYGLSDRLDLSGNLYLLPLLYSLAGLDAGVAWYPVLNDGAVPTIGIQPRIAAFASFKSGVDDRFRLYPSISSSGSWKLGSGRIYTGFDLTLPLSQPDYDPDPPHVIFSPLIGYRWNLGTSWRLFTELKWQGANIRTNATAEYSNPGGYGAISPYVAIEYAP
jgi:hypothetical protein